MLDVIFALTPALVAACLTFGWNAVRLTLTCVLVSVATEYGCRKAMRRNAGITDLSAVVTGILLAFNLPPALPTWMAAVGAFVAIAIAKQVFGGIGYNPFNPALIARAFLLISFTGPMTDWSACRYRFMDAVTTATPLGMVKEAIKGGKPLPFVMDGCTTLDFFIGHMNGCIGEVSALALLLGGLYLLFRKCITWHIPVSYLLTVTIYSTVLWLLRPEAAMPPHFHLLTGGLMLGAWFMATDMVTSPITPRGMLVFGMGCGLLTMVIRTVSAGAYPEGVSFAILLMNAFTPLINRATRPRIFGQRSTT
jgi:Na+-translocating ferredoxin:NAD+ oxidoreductase subunit D